MFELRQYALLFITATIWGAGFIAQKLGMSHVSPFVFTFFRTLLGGLFLLVLLGVLKGFYAKIGKTVRKSSPKYLIVGSVCCGFFLMVSESFQQFGLVTSDVNKASFITSLYMVFVPILGIFIGKRLSPQIILAVLVSLLGLYLLCMKGDFSLTHGDFLLLMCAVGFSLHILTISYFIQYVDGVMLSCGQFFCASVFGFIMMICNESIPTMEALLACLPAILFAGIVSNGIAYTLQIVGQRGVNPSIASMILSLESVMGAVFGVLLLNEQLSSREIAGAVLMFLAVILTQIKFSRKKASAHS